ncbi:MAG: hypothetical protein ACK4I0_00785 [Brevundimonas sp.]|uniref:hypothetical protein n=1 Tax=Brevundimonas sp. TaxID=1871086 RepID=UPI00391DC558
MSVQSPPMIKFWVVLTVCVTVSLLIGLAVLSPVPHDSAGFAAWAQAIGTVGAVLIAVLIALYQNDHAARVRRSESSERRSNAFATFRVASERVVEAIRDARARVIEKRTNQAAALIAIEAITGSVHQLEAIPVADFGSHRASLAAARFNGKARETLLTLRVVADNPTVTDAIMPSAFATELDDLVTWRKLVIEAA